MLVRVLLVTTAARTGRWSDLLHGEDVIVSCVDEDENPWERLGMDPCDLVVLDEGRLAGAVTTTLADIRALPDGPEVILLSENDQPSHRTELLAAGAFVVLNPSSTRADLNRAMETILERRASQARQNLLAEAAQEENRLSDFASSSPAMRAFLALVRRVKETDTTLLVLGETGVGKEYLSRAIHAESRRPLGPFVAVNCVALSESLLESELFGHVEGAFTGAVRSRRGYFELAHRGTLFLDEIGELTPQLQVKLLRVLEEKRIQPVGGEHEIEVDVRIIAATNRDLAAEVEGGRFRSDLYYRVSVVTLEVPPLRSRREDIPWLVESNLEHFQISLRRPGVVLREDTMRLLTAYHWPGNVRELINVIERAVLLCDGVDITPSDLPPEVRGERKPVAPLTPPRPPIGASEREEELLDRPFREARKNAVDDFERRYIEALLVRSHGRINDASRLAGINARSLYAKMRRLAIHKEHFRLG